MSKQTALMATIVGALSLTNNKQLLSQARRDLRRMQSTDNNRRIGRQSQRLAA